MIQNILKTLAGDTDARKIKRFWKEVENIKAKESQFENFTLDDVKKQTETYRALFDGLDFQDADDSKKIKNILEDIKYEAFALVKQTTKLISGKEFTLASGKKITWNMIPYDVQLIGWMVINEGAIAEMKTWEWKTLVATLPAYLNALTGNTVHVVTVNDYLAQRDAEEMSVLYEALGMSVGAILHSQSKQEKKENYQKDIIYATNNELGFDYLRDNMVTDKKDKVQSKMFFAIIDEVDSILIDEARTPLIISMPDNEPTSKYMKFATLAKKLEKGHDYKITEKQKTATLKETGIKKIEKMLWIDNIYVSDNYNDLHHIENALKATAVYIKDKDYIVRDDQIMIVDEHTGRAMAGRRYSDGLHQALEAKEWVPVQQESKTLASITFQNYFRMYWKLSGMTGTAKTEEEEFYKVYALDTLIIPTNEPIIRDDRSDLLFKNEKGKFEYVIDLIKELHETGQPILVGTVSVDKSEYLSDRLKKEGVKHNVLNAKQNETEADTVANAGQMGAVTIATNMAWRGTDIKLWEGVKEAGWLAIIGTEKHETRRIDNQLRWRSGRQWDPGMTQFLISPSDDIMRIFGGDKLFGVFNSPMFASLPENEPLAQSGMLTRKVTSVQKQVEWHNFDIRKHVLEYDDVINKHREIIYGRRNAILNSENIDEDIKEMVHNQIAKVVLTIYARAGEDDEVDKKKVIKKLNEFIGKQIIDDTIEIDDVTAINDPRELAKYIANIALEEIDTLKKDAVSEDEFYELERRIVLQSIDRLWMNHIDAMSKLRDGVAFAGYAQRNPLVEYKEQAFGKFKELIDEIEYKTVKAMFSVRKISEVEQRQINEKNMQMNDINLENMLNSARPQNNAPQKSSGNPLFAAPQAKKSSTNTKKKRIRV